MGVENISIGGDLDLSENVLAADGIESCWNALEGGLDIGGSVII